VESVVVTDTFGLRTLIQPGITTRRTIGLGGGGRRAGAGVDAAAEFIQRMSELAVALGSLRVGDAALHAPSGERLPAPDQRLNRRGARRPLDTDASERAERTVRWRGRFQRRRSLLQHRGG
jgi:hypothetical protein